MLDYLSSKGEMYLFAYNCTHMVNPKTADEYNSVFSFVFVFSISDGFIVWC